jgi:Tfp pilus assembly protein PilP
MIQTDAIDKRERTDLESVSIDDVRVVGILTGPTRTRAIAKIMSSGKTFVVGEGMRIGTDEEIIQKITSNGLVLVGSRVNTIGERETLTTELPLVLENKKVDVKSSTLVNTAQPPDENRRPQ